MQKLIKTDENGIIESTQNWPDDKPAPTGYQLKPFLADLVECGIIAKTKWRATDTPPYAEQVIPSDNEKATAIRNQLADVYNAECTEKIITGYSYKGQQVNASEKRQQEFDSLYVKKDALTYPYPLKVNSDAEREPVEINIADETEMSAFLDGLFWHYKTCLDECRNKKRANAAKTLAELQKIPVSGSD